MRISVSDTIAKFCNEYIYIYYILMSTVREAESGHCQLLLYLKKSLWQ